MVEHFVDIEGVTGSIPVTPTNGRGRYHKRTLENGTTHIEKEIRYEGQELFTITETKAQRLSNSSSKRTDICY